MLQGLSMRVLVPQFKRILREDMVRWPPVQRGLETSGQKGVLSAREERVFAFQDYIAQRLGVKNSVR
jgi:hypothetical protein